MPYSESGKYISHGAAGSDQGVTVSVRDVAQAAGVSVTTVSYVLNNKGAISEETRRRVKDAISNTGYKRQRRAAGNLALIQTHDSFLTPALTQAVGEYGYALHTLMWPDSLEQPLPFSSRQPITGVIVYGGLWRRSFLEQLAAMYPTVLLGSAIPNIQADAVWVDNAGGIYAATDTLVAQGHKHIGLLDGPALSVTSGEKLLGFTRALRHANLAQSGISEEAAEFKYEAGQEAARRLLGHTPRPTAVIACELILGQALLQVCAELHLRIPEDLSVIVFRDAKALETSYPPISAISIPALAIAREAVNILTHRMDNPHTPGRRLLLQPNIVCRSSVALCATS